MTFTDYIKMFYNFNYKSYSEFNYDSIKQYYKIILLNKMIKIFKWENLPFPAHELELYTNVVGYAACVKDAKRGMMAAYGGMSGPTQYYDYFTDFTYAAPTAAGGTVKIGRDCIILRNHPFTFSSIQHIERYAELLTHNDLSLRVGLINTRAQRVFATTDSNKAETIDEWYESLFRGKPCGIVDDEPMSSLLGTEGSIKTLELNKERIDTNIFLENENTIMRNFYRDIGIRWNKDKKANLVADEIEQDDMLLKFNINDMLEARKDFCNEYNSIFSDLPRISVRINNSYIEEG